MIENSVVTLLLFLVVRTIFDVNFNCFFFILFICSESPGAAARFVQRPRSVTVVEGEPVDIVCQVAGDPEPEVKIQKNNLT